MRMPGHQRIAELRRRRREEGYVESNVWFSPEEVRIIEHQASATGLTKSEIIRMALRKAYEQELSMNAAG